MDKIIKMSEQDLKDYRMDKIKKIKLIN